MRGCYTEYNCVVGGVPQVIRLYVDSLLLLAGSTFILDLVTLWAVRQIGGAGAPKARSGPRLAAGAGLSTAVFVAMASLAQAGLVSLTSGVSILAAAAGAGASLILAFPGMSVRGAVTAFVYRSLLTALAGGAATAAYSFTAGNPAASFIAAIATVGVVAEAGWGAVHRGIRDGLFVVPVDIDFGADRVSVQALIDTGNRLRDPASGNPVIIVEYGAIESALPWQVRAALAKSDDDFMARARAVAGSTWSSRFRAVPYSSVGREKGMMVGFRPDRVRVADGRRMVTTSRAVVCVHTSALCPGGNYRALVNPDILTVA